jgi:hypothetical protein
MILRFDDEAKRRDFLATLERERGDIFDRCYTAQNLPDVVASDLDTEQQKWLRDRLGPRAFRDQRFETF